MDRNTLIGMLLIGVVFIGFTWYNQPSEEEIAELKRQQDSIEQVQQREAQEKARKSVEKIESADQKDERKPEVLPAIDTTGMAVSDSTYQAMQDSAVLVQKQSEFGSFFKAVDGNKEYYTIENDKMIARVSTKGGRMVSVELKEYKTHDSLPLLLFEEDSSGFNYSFFEGNKLIETEELFFEAQGPSVVVSGENSASLSMRLYGASPSQYIEYIYTLNPNSYLMDYSMRVIGMDELLDDRSNAGSFGFNWWLTAPAKEKNLEYERNSTTVYYRYSDDDVDNLSEQTKDPEMETLITRTNWVSFKQQFFSAAIIPEVPFGKIDAKISSIIPEESFDYTKQLSAQFTIDVGRNGDFNTQFYFGPNHFQTLEDLDIGLENQIDLGWTIFGWVNRYLVIPVFNVLDGLGFLSYGIIILLLTIFIKMILFPLTYKNYVSSAKMKVLKPEIDQINEKYKDGDNMKKQSETMALYRKAGVNPMAGCIPMVLQMPILYAMFRFFPASIELRQQKFLWADDLSTYDSILDLSQWGIDIPFYGDHVSLFTLLMAVSTFFYTRYNMQMTGTANQMPQMKLMMYFMPVMLLGFFNGYAAGLSYYYFTANVISIVQQLVIKKWFINEKSIHAKIQANKQRTPKKKSRFQAKLEEMQRQQKGQTHQKGKKG